MVNLKKNPNLPGGEHFCDVLGRPVLAILGGLWMRNVVDELLGAVEVLLLYGDTQGNDCVVVQPAPLNPMSGEVAPLLVDDMRNDGGRKD